MHLPSDDICPYRCIGGSCWQRRTPTQGRSRQRYPLTPRI